MSAPTAEVPAVLARVREAAPRLAALTGTIDTERQLPPEAVAILHEAGVFRMAVPEEYGGEGADAVTCARVVEELSAIDGAIGWCAMINWQNTALCSWLPAEGAKEVYGAPDLAICGTARQTGRAYPRGDGYLVSGRWPFASGSRHAAWFIGECMLMSGAGPARDERGETVGMFCVLPRSAVTVHDTWHTSGLRGTGSNDFSVENLLVPASRTFRLGTGPHPVGGGRYHNPCLEFLGHGTQALGVAQGAVDAVRRLAPLKVVYGGGTMAESIRFQADFARAVALVESARSYLYGVAGAFCAKVDAGQESTAEDRARVRTATSLAAANAVEGVELLHRGMGTSVLFTENPVERRYRDIEAAMAHVMIGVHTWEAAGRVFLGREAEFPFF